MSSRSFFTRLRSFFRGLLTNLYLWGGLALLVVLVLGAYLLVDKAIMPSYTRHDAAITVPDVKHRSFAKARTMLRKHDLHVEKSAEHYTPDAPRDVVIKQSPRSSAVVKPGRRVYLTINTGQAPMVQMPPVQDLSLREAQNRIMAVGLKAAKTRPDSIPAPYKNTVTRQKPQPGDSLKKGSSVTLWYSTGLGEKRVDIPDVTGLSVGAARDTLLARKLRSVVVNKPKEATKEDVREMKVQRQSRKPGTRVRQGFEVRLFLKEQGEGENGLPQDTL